VDLPKDLPWLLLIKEVGFASIVAEALEASDGE
jgi:hypothetical protein